MHQLRMQRRSMLATMLLAATQMQVSFACADEPPLPPIVTLTGVRTERLAAIGSKTKKCVVTAITTDPLGELIAVAGDDFAIRIINMSSMKVIRTLENHRDLVRTMKFDPSGNQFVSAGNDGQLILWDRSREFKITQRMDGTPAISCVSFSPQSDEIAAVSFDRRVYLIGQRSSQTPPLNCKSNDLRAVAYRYDGDLLAAAGRSGELEMFDLRTMQALSAERLHSGRINGINFLRRSSRIVTVGDDGNVCVFDSETRQTLHRFNVTTGKLFAVAVLDDELVAVAGSDNKIRIVRLNQERTIRELDNHIGSVATLAAYDSILFSGGYDATLRRWSLSGIKTGREQIAEREAGLER
ncbi:WD40 repeat domain-containing protein [Stieleria varia]|uniref:WD domain, G-beta repeat n=1 Tax=Stieleria varia TaxID=2528005 RepID=A0A5C6B1V6_9BACT|nr:WD40 repeat domain-containing protein [Stieleria varia]TWU05880.1 WD domain, G-beta repeat [Stieleria varia]